MSTAHVRVDHDQLLGEVDPLIFGHFLESSFFGNIEGGVLDEGSSLARSGDGPDAGLRTDVIELCRRLGLPVVRWPGGNFTSSYHWTDGIGPRDHRPRRLNLDWGVEESNRFGTEEFLRWCTEVGTEPFLVHSARDVDDAVRWVEYTNYGGETELTRQRAANGSERPHGVGLWGIGNEVYGRWQMGHRSAERYASDAREHAMFMRSVDPSLRFVGVGLADEAWCRPVLQHTREALDYLSLHLYGASTHLERADRAEYEAVVAQPVWFEHELTTFADLLERLSEELGLARPPQIAMDEWNVRHLEPTGWPEPEPGADGGVAHRRGADSSDRAGAGRRRVNRWSPRTLADALCYAGVFHALHRLSGRAAAPSMANTVNLVNANGLIVVRPGGALASATYQVWDLYQNHLGRRVHPVAIEAPTRVQAVRRGDARIGDGFATRAEAVSDLDVIATSGTDGLRLAMINRSPDEPCTVRLRIGEQQPATARVWQLGAATDDLFAVNTFEAPQTVAVRELGAVEVSDGITLPPHSITVLGLAV